VTKLTLSADEIAEIRQIFENHPVAFSDEQERSAATLLAKLAPEVDLTDEEARILTAHIDHYEHVIGTTVGDHLLDRLSAPHDDR
jgi:hypothetical protein